MTITELARKVLMMRDAQKQFFRTRSPDALNASKSLEREVDSAVAEILAPAPKAPCMFPEEE